MNQEILSLRREATELPAIMMSGTMLRHGEVWAALPREAVAGVRGVESIIFEVIRPEYLSKPSWLKAWFKAVRPGNLTMTMMPSLAVLMVGYLKGWEASWTVGSISLLGVLFLHVSVNVLNDVEDHLRLIDLPGTFGGSGVIQKGWLNAHDLRVFGYLTFGMGLLCGLPAAIKSPAVLLWIGGVVALGVIGYSNRPFGVKYRVIGDLCLLALVGPLLTIGFSQATFGVFDSSLIWLGLSFGFAACGISHSSNLQDIEADLQNGIKTLASGLGFKISRHVLAGFYGLSAMSLMYVILDGGLPKGTALGAGIGFFWILRFLLKVYKASGPMSALLSSIRLDSSRAHLVLSLSICASFCAYLIGQVRSF